MTESILPAPLWRRAIAMVYDGLLLIGLWLLVLWGLVVTTSLQGGELARSTTQIAMLVVGGVYFAWSWTRGGQTLGMRVWRLHLRRYDGMPVRLPVALARYLAAWVSLGAAGIGFVWSLIDPQRRTMHDIVTGTEMVVLPSESATSRGHRDS